MANAILVDAANNGADVLQAGGLGIDLYSGAIQNLFGTIQGVYICADLDLTVTFNGNTVEFLGCKAGSILPIRPSSITAISTLTLTDVVILFNR